MINILKITDYDSILSVASTLKDHFTDKAVVAIHKDAMGGICYGAYRQEKLIGFVIYKEISNESMELAWMGVLKEVQGAGIGSKLVEISLKELSGKYKACEVKTLSDKVDYGPYEKTRKFYKRLGFISLETIDPYPGWDDACQIFVRFLG